LPVAKTLSNWISAGVENLKFSDEFFLQNSVQFSFWFWSWICRNIKTLYILQKPAQTIGMGSGQKLLTLVRPDHFFCCSGLGQQLFSAERLNDFHWGLLSRLRLSLEKNGPLEVLLAEAGLKTLFNYKVCLGWHWWSSTLFGALNFSSVRSLFGMNDSFG